jgi:lipoate-protein ligase A
MKYPEQLWRLLITTASSGARNMAIDEALLESVGKNLSLPCLRLYAWEPPCLSIGYAQPSSDIDVGRLSRLGWEWVRRPTGGRAILHTDELTYSVIAPVSEPRVRGSVLESYQRLSQALLVALNKLNIPAHANPLTPASKVMAPVCFEVPSNYEIVVQEKKLMGSAQARRKQVVLQHGTLPLWGDLTRITQGLVYSTEQKRQDAAVRLLSHATTAEEILGYKLDMQAVYQAFVSGFQSALNIKFLQSDLTDDENDEVARLVTEKYTHPSWLERL